MQLITKRLVIRQIFHLFLNTFESLAKVDKHQHKSAQCALRAVRSGDLGGHRTITKLIIINGNVSNHIS